MSGAITFLAAAWQNRIGLAIGLAVAGAAAAGPWSPVPPVAAETMGVIALGLACAIPVLAVAEREEIDIFDLGVAVGIAYFVLFPLRALVVLLGLDAFANPIVLGAPSMTIRLVLAVTSLGMASGGLAYTAARRLIPRRARLPTPAWFDSPNLALSLGLFAIGIAAQASVLIHYYSPARFAAIGPQSFSVISELSVLMLAGLALLARRAALDTASRPRIALAFAVAAGVALGVLGEFKETAVLAVLVPLVVWRYTSPTGLPWRSILVAALLAAFIIFPTVQLARHAQLRLRTSNPIAVVQALPEEATMYDWRNGSGPQPLPPGELVSFPFLILTARLYGFDAMTVAVMATPSRIPYQEGGTLIQLWQGLVPRVLWAGKPNIGLGSWFAANYWAPGSPSAPQAMTHPGELWIDFGWPGVVLGLGILGVLYRLLFALLDPIASPIGAVVYSVVFSTLIVVDTDIPFVYITLIQRVVTLACLFVGISLVVRLAKSRGARIGAA